MKENEQAVYDPVNIIRFSAAAGIIAEWNRRWCIENSVSESKRPVNRQEVMKPSPKAKAKKTSAKKPAEVRYSVAKPSRMSYTIQPEERLVDLRTPSGSPEPPRNRSSIIKRKINERREFEQLDQRSPVLT